MIRTHCIIVYCTVTVVPGGMVSTMNGVRDDEIQYISSLATNEPYPEPCASFNR